MTEISVGLSVTFPEMVNCTPTFVHVESQSPHSNPNHAFLVVKELDGLGVQGEIINMLRKYWLRESPHHDQEKGRKTSLKKKWMVFLLSFRERVFRKET